MNTALAPITIADLTVVAGEPRIASARVAERLGYDRPNYVNRLVSRHMGELESHGEVLRRFGAKPGMGSKGGRPEEGFWLNEGQALVVCMLSRTPKAAAIRKEVIGVYMAHRRGQLTPASSDPFERMANRQDAIRRTVAFHAETKSPDFRENLAHLLTEGKGNRRLPPWWGDVEVRQAMISLHRQASLDEVRGVLIDRFGPMRTPSRSAMGRFWTDLDRARGAAFRHRHGGMS